MYYEQSLGEKRLEKCQEAITTTAVLTPVAREALHGNPAVDKKTR